MYDDDDYGISRYNPSGARDDTARDAFRNIGREHNARCAIKLMIGIASLVGFSIKGKITLCDLKTGKEYQ